MTTTTKGSPSPATAAGQGPAVAPQTGPTGGAGPGEPPGVRGLGVLGWARWAWRQLVSMRTALLLLLLLAVGAVPGSVFPQTGIDPVRVSQYEAAHADLAPVLRKLGAFDVYGSPWFAAIYLLLFISLVGCVLPRSRVYLRALREQPPRTPANLERLPEHRRAEVAARPDDVLAAASVVLRRRHYRVVERPGSLAAQRGELREAGNLVFHLALIGVLISFASSSLWGYRGQVIVPSGSAFVDSPSRIDSFTRGALVDPDDLPPFRFTVKALQVKFDDSSAGNQFGAPRSFAATIDVVDAPGATPRRERITVNHPLSVAGEKVYLAGNGYAPVITVRDASGHATTQTVPFLVRDATYTSSGVVKVTEASPQQIGIQALFLPTAPAEIDPKRGPISAYPGLKKPQLVFTAYTGDLGLDTGVPQNVYELDRSRMTQLTAADGEPFSASIGPGQSAVLPGGAGTVTFDGVERYAGFTFRHDPGRQGALVFALLAIAGLTVSLFVPRRRVWVKVTTAADGLRTVMDVGALARSEDHGLGWETEAILAAVLTQTGHLGGRGDGADVGAQPGADSEVERTGSTR